LRTAFLSWWRSEQADWDQLVADGLTGSADLWNNMPTVDSKAVARSSPIFQEILGIPLDPKLIRAGGYARIEDAADALIPLMVAKARSNRGQE